MTTTIKPVIGKYLDKDEKILIESIEQAAKDGTLSDKKLSASRLNALQRSAKTTRKEQRTAISIRLRSTDLTKIKARAERKDVPYQTLIQSIIHQYVSGDLVEKL